MFVYFDILSWFTLKPDDKIQYFFFTYKVKYSISNHILQFLDNRYCCTLLKNEEIDSLLYIPILNLLAF